MLTRKTTTKKASIKSLEKLLVAKKEHPTTKYAKQILNGEFICCESERKLAEKHIRDLARQGTKGFPYVFDESRANRFFMFYNICINPDTSEYYKILPHQMFDNGLLYGWVNKDTGKRKYTKVYQQEAKGQAKTTTCAIRAMFALIADMVYLPNDEQNGRIIPNAEIHLMAVDREQARELREPIVTISQQSPYLREMIDAKVTQIKGVDGGWIRVLSKDFKNKQGGKPNMVIIDELSSHPDGKRASVAEGNLGKKEQSLVYIITTAGDNEMTNPAKKEYDRAKKVLWDEMKDESYLPIIREVEEKDDIHDKTLWQKSHPMFRYLSKYEYANNLYNAVEKLYNQAYKGDDAELKRQFLIFRMNQWQERAVNSYLSQSQIKKLDSLAVSKEEWDRLTFGRPKIVGFDFAIRRDLTASGDVFLLDDGRIAIDAHGYMLEQLITEREKSDSVPYSEWARQGYLSILPKHQYGLVMDKEYIARDFIARAEQKKQEIKEVCFDTNWAMEMVQDLIMGKYGSEFNENNVLAVTQDKSNLFEPTRRLREVIVLGNLVWNGNPLLRWCFTNCYTVTFTSGKIIDGIKVKKENADSHRRIDLVAAIITALKRVDVLRENNNNLSKMLIELEKANREYEPKEDD